MTDDELVRFFAHVRDSDLVPGGGPGLLGMLRRLAELGIVAEPLKTDLVRDVVQDARATCQVVLEYQEKRDFA